MLVLLLILSLFFPKNILAVSPKDITITDFSSNSNPEWVQIKNNTNQNITLENWYFTDNSNHSKNIDTFCLSPLSIKTINYSSGWLNNDGDAINLYDNKGSLIDTLIYSKSEVKEQSSVQDTNTCALPTPTADPTVVNPISGISLTEFMPYSSIEWIELYNDNDFDVKLVAWKIEDNEAHTKNISELNIEAKSYAIFEFSLLLNNSESDKIILYNQDQKIIDSYQYESNKFNLEKSWSKVNGNWCQADVSRGASNNNCFSVSPTSTSTPTPTTKLTPTTTFYTTSTPTITPILSETSLSEDPTPSDLQTETSTQDQILGDSDSSQEKLNQNFLPIVLIIGGGVLLLSPLLFSKIKTRWPKK